MIQPKMAKFINTFITMTKYNHYIIMYIVD